MQKLTGVFEKAQLSGRAFLLKPHYTHIPQIIEADDRVFDPRVESKTHTPMKIGEIEAKDIFNRHAVEGYASLKLWINIKRPLSDTYHIPKEMEQFREFIQKVIDFEHNRTPAAFTRTALLYLRQGTGTDTSWHYDARPEETTSSWHYVVSNILPTQSTVLNFTPEQRARAEFDGSFRALYGMTPFEDLKKGLYTTTQANPYDITRHSSSVLHKGTVANDSRTRTFASISYMDVFDPKAFNCFEWKGVKNLKHTSPPIEKAAALLERYLH